MESYASQRQAQKAGKGKKRRRPRGSDSDSDNDSGSGSGSDSDSDSNGGAAVDEADEAGSPVEVWANKADFELRPLYASMPPEAQLRAFQPCADKSARKFILSTNIAETSVTINDITYVCLCLSVSV